MIRLSPPPGHAVCLITGASAGIGAAFAHVFAAAGWDLALTARRAERLRALQDAIEDRYPVSTFALPCDLADPDAPQALLDEIARQDRRVLGLVNNAGFGLREEASPLWDSHAAMLQVMATAPSALAHAALGQMNAAGFGRMINVSSLLGLMPASGGGLYGPIKAYLVQASLSWRSTAEEGVHVTALCPGLTVSEFHDVNGAREAVHKAAPDFLWQSARTVALSGARAVERNAAIVTPGFWNTAMAGLAGILPPVLARALAASAQGRVRTRRAAADTARNTTPPASTRRLNDE